MLKVARALEPPTEIIALKMVADLNARATNKSGVLHTPSLELQLVVHVQKAFLKLALFCT